MRHQPAYYRCSLNNDLGVLQTLEFRHILVQGRLSARGELVALFREQEVACNDEFSLRVRVPAGISVAGSRPAAADIVIAIHPNWSAIRILTASARLEGYRCASNI
jgi:hypothetical protein